MTRISASERARVAYRAEQEILRYKDDHMLWHKHVHNVELDPVQVFDPHPRVFRGFL